MRCAYYVDHVCGKCRKTATCPSVRRSVCPKGSAHGSSKVRMLAA